MAGAGITAYCRAMLAPVPAQQPEHLLERMFEEYWVRLTT